MQHLMLTSLVLGGTLLTVALGCSDGRLEKVVLHGAVTYEGKPLPHGQIRFIPLEGTQGPISGGVIADGNYVANGKGGVPLGKHRVEIRAYRPTNGRASAAFQAEGGATEQYLPGRYNGGSILTAEVTSESGSKSIDFDLDSRNASGLDSQ